MATYKHNLAELYKSSDIGCNNLGNTPLLHRWVPELQKVATPKAMISRLLRRFDAIFLLSHSQVFGDQ